MSCFKSGLAMATYQNKNIIWHRPLIAKAAARPQPPESRGRKIATDLSLAYTVARINTLLESITSCRIRSDEIFFLAANNLAGCK